MILHLHISKPPQKSGMEVKFSETAIIHPDKPPFDRDHILSLSHLDTDRNLNVTFRYVRAYVSAGQTADPFHVITTALSTALVAYYPFTGTLCRRDSDGRLELHCSAGGGVPVVKAAVDCTLKSVNYLDDADEMFVEKLVPDPDAEYGLTRPLILQITMFSCGGYCLGAAVHHSTCDGMGATQFFNAMAELARGSNWLSVEPVWDRVSNLGPREPVRLGFPIQDYLYLDKEFSPYSQTDEPVVRELFNVKEAWLDRFKEFLLDQSGLKFTTFEAFGAFIWQARVKHSKITVDETVKFVYAINIRKLVDPPLPAGYWGNGCVPMYAQVTAGDLINQPIWKTAKIIKDSKRNARTEYVRSFIDFQELNYSSGITAGKGVSGYTDWRHLGHSTVDFGWGGPITVLPLSKNLLGSVEPCFFLPFSKANEGVDDGFKVSVCLKKSALPGFKEEMIKFSKMDFGFLSSN